MYSDAELVNLTLDSDKEFFTPLMERYYARIFRYLRRLLSNHREDAEECLSETFLKAYVNLSTYNPRIPFSAWLYRIAHNQAVDLIRRNTRRRTETFEDHHDAAYDPATLFLEKDRLERMLGRLEAEDRSILTLFYLEGLTLEEISDIMKVKPNTVAVRIKRAKEKIRKQKNY